LALAAALVERPLAAAGAPRRLPWIAAMVGALVLPLSMLVTAGPDEGSLAATSSMTMAIDGEATPPLAPQLGSPVPQARYDAAGPGHTAGLPVSPPSLPASNGTSATEALDTPAGIAVPAVDDVGQAQAPIPRKLQDVFAIAT